MKYMLKRMIAMFLLIRLSIALLSGEVYNFIGKIINFANTYFTFLPEDYRTVPILVLLVLICIIILIVNIHLDDKAYRNVNADNQLRHK